MASAPAQRTAELHRLPAPPWARVQRVQLVRREVREYVPVSAMALLLSRAECVVEAGQEVGSTTSPGERRVYATVMVTIDLRAAASMFREPADVATAQRVAELMESAAVVAQRLREWARPELSRLAGAAATALEISLEHHARAEGSKILIDGDAMAIVPANPGLAPN